MLIFSPFVFFVKYGTTRFKEDPVDGSLSYPEPAPDHGMPFDGFRLLICLNE